MLMQYEWEPEVKTETLATSPLGEGERSAPGLRKDRVLCTVGWVVFKVSPDQKGIPHSQRGSDL